MLPSPMTVRRLAAGMVKTQSRKKDLDMEKMPIHAPMAHGNEKIRR